MAKIIIVVAVAENGIIGAGGDMPWRLSTDLKRFKALTIGKPILMGRKTFEAIGNKPLGGRTNIVITRDESWQSDGVHVAHSLESALEIGQKHLENTNEICVIGGGEIYKQAIDLADFLYITWVCASPDGDTSFPKVDETVWNCLEEHRVPAGPDDDVETRYCTYSRR